MGEADKIVAMRYRHRGDNMADTNYDIAFLKRKLLAYMGADANAYPIYLEQHFPHILEQLVMLWGTPGMGTYLQRLMVSDRPNRRGFPPEAIKEIFRLSMLQSASGIAEEPVVTGWAGLDGREYAKYLERVTA